MPLEDNVQIQAVRHALGKVEKIQTVVNEARADLAAALDILKEQQEEDRRNSDDGLTGADTW